jgi:hypothetical protein
MSMSYEPIAPEVVTMRELSKDESEDVTGAFLKQMSNAIDTGLSLLFCAMSPKCDIEVRYED